MALPDRHNVARKRLRSPTILEPIEELLGLSEARPTVKESPPRAETPPPPHSKSEEISAFRPSLRPPMAILCVYDDGQDTGEIVRVRTPSFVIGRTEGNVIVPHDAGISGRHAEIGRRFADERHRWYLRDLGSTNGTFIRTTRAVLRGGQEILIGGVRFRFDLPCASPEHDAKASGQHEDAARPDPARASADSSAPSLVEIGPDGEGWRTALNEEENWIGRQAGGCVLVIDEPCVNPKHALIKRKKNGKWVIENARSRDGTWLRISEIELGRGAQFQCGEQRFLVRIV
jgi:pSer/pThr/pTyr-binding forkhead associated (FHA) protein